MPQVLAYVALVVRDYDEAIAFFVGKLGFDLLEDTYQPEQDKRWVVVRPSGGEGCSVLLSRASSEHQSQSIGNQAGGRVFSFLRTDDFWRDYRAFVDRGIEFEREPKEADYGLLLYSKTSTATSGT
jgi:catechol 2,3-dioxygenase-like lactoylglutathione lyase family enzyme